MCGLGNDGSKGAFYSSAPGNALSAISVASVDNIAVSLQNATVHGVAHDPITYFDTFPFPVLDTLPIFVTSNDTTVEDDACSPLPDSTPDLSGFLVIIRRGTCSFVSAPVTYMRREILPDPLVIQVQKLTNVAAKNGTRSLIYE